MDLGFDTNNVATLVRPENVSLNNWNLFKNELLNESKIESIGQAVFPTIGEYNSLQLTDINDNTNFKMYWIGVDPEYLKTLDIKFVNGRGFTTTESDKFKFILNEKAAALIGGDLYNKEFKFSRIRDTNARLLGVVRDFTFSTLKEEVPPVILSLGNPMAMRNMVVKYDMGMSYQNLQDIIKVCAAKANIESDLRLGLLESEFSDKLVGEEVQLNQTVIIFCVVSSIISVLGLVGFLSFSLTRRQKELSIRKVLGATVSNNFFSIVKTNLVLLLFASFIASFAAIKVLEGWLGNFVWHVDISFYHLIVPLVIAILVLLSVGYAYSRRVLIQSPMKNLREV